MQILEGHRGKVASLDFSPDGCHLASCGNDGTLRIWDTQTGEHEILSEAVGRGEIVAFVSPAQVVLLTSPSRLQVWNVHEPAMERLLIGPGGFYRVGMAVGVPQSWVAFNEWEIEKDLFHVRVWKARSGNEVFSHSVVSNRISSPLAFDPTGTKLATVDGIFDVQSEEHILDTHFDFATSRWSPNGAWLAHLEHASKRIHISDARTGETVAKLSVWKKAVQDVGFTRDSAYLVSVGNEKIVRVWRTSDWKECPGFSWGIGALKCLAFSPDGCRVACGGSQGRIVVWDWDR